MARCDAAGPARLLDRTLLAGASGPIYAEAMRDVGLLPPKANPAEGLVFRLFDTIGETYPTMLATRQGARMVRGWPLNDVTKAAALAAPILVGRIQPYTATLIDRHRAEGRKLVIATTTPDHLVRPLAEELGFDDVVATRYDHDGDKLTGAIDGPFVWGRDKARSVRAWAEANDIDLGASHAYSDSYYDVPMLSIVGNPVAVNPDPRLRVQALARRWPVQWFDVPSKVPKFMGLEPQQVAMAITKRSFMPYVKFRTYGDKRIPESGPAIIVANHRSYFDPLAIGLLLARRGRPVRFLGKKEVFDAPIVGDVARAMGGIRVDRATGSDEPLVEAEEALTAGDMVAIMPQGTIPRGRNFFDPELKGRWGAMKLAHAVPGVPVIPIGLWGTEKVWPRSSRFPNVANVLSPPTVTMRVGRPVELGYDDVASDTERMMEAVMSLLPPAARRTHEPTLDELALTVPPGADPAEFDEPDDRRPGED